MADNNTLGKTLESIVGSVFQSAFKSTSSVSAIASALSSSGGASKIQKIYYRNTKLSDDEFIDDEPFRDDTIGTVKVYGKVWMRQDPSAVGLERLPEDPSQLLEVYRFPSADGENGGLDTSLNPDDPLKSIAINGIQQGVNSLANLIFRTKDSSGNTTTVAKNGTTNTTTGEKLPTNLSDAKKAQNGYKLEDLINVDAGASCCDSILVSDCNGNWVTQTKTQFLEGM